MYRNKRHHGSPEHEELDRWLVSYADYMTLMFALFVMLYAMAIVKEEEYEVLSETLTRVFETRTSVGKGVIGEGLLLTNEPVDSEFELYGNALQEEKGPKLVDGEIQLSEVLDNKIGSPLSSLEELLNDALFDLVENGYAEVQRSQDWVTIELDSALLFIAGSATPTRSAQLVMKTINDIIGPVENYIRLRGYTDDRPIQTEIYPSNWELSVARAMAALKMLEALEVNPARMALEGYGQYAPFADNGDVQGRAKNRKVVVALSKYGLQPVAEKLAGGLEDVLSGGAVAEGSGDHQQVQVIELPSGGIRITTRKEQALRQQPGKDNKSQ